MANGDMYKVEDIHQFAKEMIGKPFHNSENKEIGRVMDAWVEGNQVVAKAEITFKGKKMTIQSVVYQED